MKKTLYIHIGAPKCGSTYIQDLIKNNVTELNNNGYLTEPWLNYDNHWSLAAYCCNETDRAYFSNVLNAFSHDTFNIFQEEICSKLEQFNESLRHYNFALVSSEAYFSFCSNAESLEILKEVFLSKFDEINVLFFYREPRDYISSIYSQLIKGPQLYTGTPSDFTLDQKKTSLFSILKHLENWRCLNIPTHIKIIKVGKAGFQGKDLGRKFFYTIGITSHKRLNLEATEHNSSPSAIQLNMLRIRNKILCSRYFLSKKDPYNGIFRRLTSYLIMKIPGSKKFELDLDTQNLLQLNKECEELDQIK